MRYALDAADWLILAAGLRETSIITNGLHSDDAFCSIIYEEERGRATTAAATELTRVLFLWGAVEVMMRGALPDPPPGTEGRPRRLSRLADAAEVCFVHCECAAGNLLQTMAVHESPEFARILEKVNKSDFGTIGRGTQAAVQLRNALAHGAVDWPDGDRTSPLPTVTVARLAARVLALRFSG